MVDMELEEGEEILVHTNTPPAPSLRRTVPIPGNVPELRRTSSGLSKIVKRDGRLSVVDESYMQYLDE